MARRSQHSFLKRQKEIKRKDEAMGKMARRQGKVERSRGPEEPDQPKGPEDEQQLNAPDDEVGS